VLLLAPLLLAPTAMVAVSLAERRFGPAAAGRLNAAPLSIAIAILAVATDRGRDAGADVAAAAAAHVPAQVAFAAAFAAVLAATGAAAGDRARAAAWLAGRGAAARGLLSLAAATVVFVAASVVISTVPEPVAIVAAVPALVAGRRALASRGGDVDEWDGGAREIGVRAAIALAFVLAVLVTVRAAGPGLGGAVAAFPALTATLATMICRARGPLAATHLLGGVVTGLSGYLLFCVAVASAAPELGMLAAPLAIAACLAANVPLRPVARLASGS
jgi:hypothetical protein